MCKKIISVFIFLLLSHLALALEIPELKGRINDYAGILTKEQAVELEALLQNAAGKTSSQVALLTIPSLEEESLEDFTLRVAEKWKLGQKGTDNGALLLIAAKEKKLRIEAGYGLESVLTDAKCGFIIRNIIVVDFKKGKFYEGIKGGLAAITGTISNEFQISDEDLAEYAKQQKPNSKSHLSVGVLIFLIMMLFGGGLGRRRGGNGVLPWLVAGSMLGGVGRRGDGGGRFSGGGGGFGGGGSSGGW